MHRSYSALRKQQAFRLVVCCRGLSMANKSWYAMCSAQVHDAGHMVPMDQPKAALAMLRRWMNGSLTEDQNIVMVADA